MKLKEKSHIGSKYLQLKTKGLWAVLYRIFTSQLGKNIMQYKCEQRKQTVNLEKKNKWPRNEKIFKLTFNHGNTN